MAIAIERGSNPGPNFGPCSTRTRRCSRGLFAAPVPFDRKSSRPAHPEGDPAVMNSATSWRRQGSHHRRLCARAGCSAAATTTLRFQPTLRQAWLVDLDESAARTQGDLCHRHAAALVLPRGWELHDDRTDGSSRRVEQPPAERASEPSARRVRARRRASTNGSNPERAPGQLPGFEVDAGDDALNAILDARTPMLRRAFRNAKPDA